MSARKKWISLAFISITLSSIYAEAADPSEGTPPSEYTDNSLTKDAIAKQLGWVISNENNCGGYYLDQPFTLTNKEDNPNTLVGTSDQTLFSLHGTSILEGKVTINRAGQQITTNKAYIYRDPATGKLNAMDMIGNIHLRDANTLVLAKKGRYNFTTNTKSLLDILYRVSISGRMLPETTATPAPIQQNKIEPPADLSEVRKITKLTAWGAADEFSQTQPKIYELSAASYTTCPPLSPAWQVKASHIELDKNSGRGVATHARLLVKNIPVFYTPYINFPIDARRKTGFLYPTVGINNNWGPYVLAPFYWNMAPNYDMTITPGILTKRGLQLTDLSRYLTQTSDGQVIVSVLPSDMFFRQFQNNAKDDPLSVEPAAQPQQITDAELNRLISSSTTRSSFIWRDKSRFNEYWSSNVDFNYVSDDYYLQDFGSNLNEITDNQLLQEGDLFYKSPHWNFTGRVQSYQTLHPVNSAPVENEYRRFPQLILNADYPDQPGGFEYFINNEVTHFEILKDPGVNLLLPTGDRLHTQPGVSLPLSWPYFYINPRVQFALTEYSLYQVADTNTPTNKKRALPIIDIASGFSFVRNLNIFGHQFQQTLEPQFYYTYIPYRNQASIPLFDTTVNNLTYDQLFNYNRFTGLDRIGDANQIATGITTRLMDADSGWEKARLGIGGIIYFAERRVTLCNNNSCTDNPNNHVNSQRLSPITGTFNYHVNPAWTFNANALWNPVTKQIDNTTLGLHFEPREQHVINLNYSFARNGDYFTGIVTNTARNNLKLTDISFEWPLFREITAVGRWAQDWSSNHFQNLLYGLQYDTCCWAARFVGERTFKNQLANESPQYNSGFYLQFSLKGLTTIGSGDATGLLNRSIPGYKTQFGQEI